MVAESLKLRPLGILEKYHAVRYQMGIYTSVGLTATYRLPPAKDRSLKDDVYRACEIAIQKLQNLSLDVVLEGIKEPYFVRRPEIDLRKCVVFEQRRNGSPEEQPSTDAEVDELLNKHHNTWFEPEAPFWKLCILEDPLNSETFTAAFLFHHAIGDGTSGKVFHTTFAQALDQVLQEAPQSDVSSIVTPPAIESLPQPLEKQMDLTLSPWFLAKEAWKSKFQSHSHDHSTWAGAPVIPNTCTHKTNTKHLVVPELTATKLRKTCSANGATITSFLQILLARLLFNKIDDKFTKIIFAGSMSARRWMSYPGIDDIMGDLVLDYGEKYNRETVLADGAESFPWHEAKAAKKFLMEKVASKGKNSGVALLKFVPNVGEDVLAPRFGRQRSDGFEISNLGAFKMKKSGSEGVSIERMLFTQDAGGTGSAIVVSTISGGDGCLTLSFNWHDSVVEVSFVVSLMSSVEQEIVKLSS